MNVVRKARNIEEVKQQIDNFVKQIVKQKGYSCSGIRKTPIRQDEACMTQHSQDSQEDPEPPVDEGLVLYVTLRR